MRISIVCLRESDFISLHVPLLPETRHLISTEAFEKMKRTAYLINTSRGPVVDEAALVAALEKRKSPAPRSTSTSTNPKSARL